MMILSKNVASMTKLMTAGVVGNLVAQGVLEWDIPVSQYLPELAKRTNRIGREATVTDLLANHTGLSAQNTFRGTMMEDIIPGREGAPRMACHIPAIGEFGKSFIYSTWGYGLITSLVERVTKKPFSVCIQDYIFTPLGMDRSTTNIPHVENVVFKHWVGTDGVAHKFTSSNYRGWSDEAGFGGIEHQTKNDLDETLESPFKYVRRLLTPFIGIGSASPEEQGYYCLGTYRTRLPGMLSAASYNSTLLQKQNCWLFGKNHAGHSQSPTAIVVLVNSLPLFDITDITDIVGQLVRVKLLDEADPPDFLDLAKSVLKVKMSVYNVYASALAKKRTDLCSQFPSKQYAGDYWDKHKIICYSVSVCEDQLKMIVKGSTLTIYMLQHWGGDLFCLPPRRNQELSQSIWSFASIKTRLFNFDCNSANVLSFAWHHDATPGSHPETFVKDIEESLAKF